MKMKKMLKICAIALFISVCAFVCNVNNVFADDQGDGEYCISLSLDTRNYNYVGGKTINGYEVDYSSEYVCSSSNYFTIEVDGVEHDDYYIPELKSNQSNFTYEGRDYNQSGSASSSTNGSLYNLKYYISNVEFPEVATSSSESSGTSKRYASVDLWIGDSDSYVPSYYIYFDLNEGSFQYSDTGIYVYDGELLSEPETPKRGGYTFEGWYIDEECNTEYNFNIPVIRAFTLYAKWEEVDPETTYAINFYSNGGSAVNGQNVLVGQTVTRPADPTKENYVLEGWYTDSSLWSNYKYDFSTPVYEDFNLYAKWLPANPTVTFNSNGGSAVDSQQVSNGQPVARPTDPTKESFRLKCWATQSWNGACKYYTYDFSTPVTDNITLYAIWEEVYYNVTFNVNGGSAVQAQSIRSGQSALEPTVPTKDDYTFEGWFIDPEFETAFDFSMPVTDDVELYAKWEKIKYTVTFDTKGASAIEPQVVEINGLAQEPEDPEYGTFILLGWYSDANFTTEYDFDTPVTDNITLYAKWEMTQKVFDLSIDDKFYIELETTKGHTLTFGLTDYVDLTDEELANLETPMTREQYEAAKDTYKEVLKKYGELLGIYEITVKDETNTEYHDGPFTFKVKMTDAMKEFNTFKLIYVDDNMNTEDPITLKVEDGYLVGTLEHLSTYGLAGSYNNPLNPATGDQVIFYVALLGVCVVAGGIVIILSKKKNQTRV